jgi:hypothetical protein
MENTGNYRMQEALQYTVLHEVVAPARRNLGRDLRPSVEAVALAARQQYKSRANASYLLAVNGD